MGHRPEAAEPEIVEWPREGTGRSSLMGAIRGDGETGASSGGGLFEDLASAFEGSKKVKVEEQQRQACCARTTTSRPGTAARGTTWTPARSGSGAPRRPNSVRFVSNIGSKAGYPDLVSTYVPPGWPSQVHPPGTDRFEDTALGWLLELVPPEYRRYGVLRRYPIALARMARQHVSASVEAAREGSHRPRRPRRRRPPHGVDSVLDAYRREGARLVAVLRAVELVETALRGLAEPDDPAHRRPFTPKL